jgi:hypothetical protein
VTPSRSGARHPAQPQRYASPSTSKGGRGSQLEARSACSPCVEPSPPVVRARCEAPRRRARAQSARSRRTLTRRPRIVVPRSAAIT